MESVRPRGNFEPKNPPRKLQERKRQIVKTLATELLEIVSVKLLVFGIELHGVRRPNKHKRCVIFIGFFSREGEGGKGGEEGENGRVVGKLPGVAEIYASVLPEERSGEGRNEGGKGGVHRLEKRGEAVGIEKIEVVTEKKLRERELEKTGGGFGVDVYGDRTGK